MSVTVTKFNLETPNPGFDDASTTAHRIVAPRSVVRPARRHGVGASHELRRENNPALGRGPPQRSGTRIRQIVVMAGAVGMIDALVAGRQQPPLQRGVLREKLPVVQQTNLV